MKHNFKKWPCLFCKHHYQFIIYTSNRLYNSMMVSTLAVSWMATKKCGNAFQLLCHVWPRTPGSRPERERDYGHALRKHVYPSSSLLFCPEAWKFLVLITLVWSSEEFTLQKFGVGLVAKFSFGVYSGEAKGSVLDPRVTFVCFWSSHVLLRDRDIFFLFYHEASPK
jgi:hypothetical protein